MSPKRTAVVAGLALSMGAALWIPAELPAGTGDVFARNNLVAWCIVPFDSQHRGPVERAAMLKRLGITMLAYDWRDQHIPTFDQEADALKEAGIKFQSFWLTSGKDPASDQKVKLVLDFL